MNAFHDRESARDPAGQGGNRPPHPTPGHPVLRLQRQVGNRATSIFVQRNLDGVNQSTDLTALDDAALSAEYQRVHAALRSADARTPGYNEAAAYLETIETAMAGRPGLTSATPPAAPVEPGVAELNQLILNQRGFSSTAPRGGRPAQTPTIDPAGVGTRHLGQGYEVNAAVVVRDRAGGQLAAELGRYARGADLHAEVQAVDALTSRLPAGAAEGGELLVVVDQMPCPTCRARLTELAERLGCRRIVAYGPSRPTATGAPAQPRTAARSWTQGPRPGGPPRQPVEAVELWAAEVPPRPTSAPASTPAPPAEVSTPVSPAEAPVAAPPVEGAAPPVEGAAPATESPGGARSGGRSGGGSGGAVLSVALGFFYQWAHQRAVEHRRDTEGYAPVGPLEFADEDLLSRIGRWVLDPLLDSQADLGSRLNVDVWRRRVREAVAAHQVDGVVTIVFQVEFPSTGILQDVRDIPITYTRQQDGTWRAGSGGQAMPAGASVPDLNRIIDRSVSDDAVRHMLEYNPNSA
ncbi:hypothetical protein [Saccharothrix variisporea]|uniref:Uncharacterized protein n=1 Tax=Saccharothrix variisporea TaxID=543527 RepID=A0A495XJC3_9PSEU|nr:hypothetical protein [Saccharothrix variisporea]RKT74621.1 hypothetical protein DFJ66_7988 [Saccharothrix variisporea]